MTSELKAAAEHLRRWDAGECPSAIYPDATDPIESADNDAWDLSREFRKHLAADEQREREDALPIDDERLRSFGFYSTTDGGRIYEHQDVEGYFYLNDIGVWEWNCEVYRMGDFIRCGQLRKLLEALKGGAL